jgi:hypothetical protein
MTARPNSTSAALLRAAVLMAKTILDFGPDRMVPAAIWHLEPCVFIHAAALRRARANVVNVGLMSRYRDRLHVTILRRGQIGARRFSEKTTRERSHAARRTSSVSAR